MKVESDATQLRISAKRTVGGEPGAPARRDRRGRPSLHRMTHHPTTTLAFRSFSSRVGSYIITGGNEGQH